MRHRAATVPLGRTRRDDARHHRRARARRGAIALGAIAVVLAACSATSGERIVDGPRSGALHAPAAPTRYEQGPCPFPEPDAVEVRCGTLVAPRNRDRDQGTVEVAVAVLEARGGPSRRPPVVYFEGGPGGAALAHVDWWVDHPLLWDHDVVLFDQRGTGYSVPGLDCDEEFADHQQGELALGPLVQCRERLSQTTVLSDFSTLEAAHDVVDLLEQLELDEAIFVGISYGTRLALVTADLFPGNLQAMVLDSVYPPGIAALEMQGPNGVGALEEVFDACAADHRCDQDYPDLPALFDAALTRLGRDRIEVDFGDGITPDLHVVGEIDLIDALFGALYDRWLIAEVPYVLWLVADGDPDDVQYAFDLLLWDGHFDEWADDEDLDDWSPDDGDLDDGDLDDGPSDDGVAARPVEPLEDSVGLYLSVTCTEEPLHNTVAGVTGAVEHLPERTAALFMVRAIWELQHCDAWFPDPVPVEALSPVRSDVPTLLLAGRFDPITPPHYAVAAARTLPNSHTVVLDGVGHGVMDSHRCGMRVARSFLEDPTVGPDAVCVDRVEPPWFTPRDH